jgi:diacylglycerol kinase family enzyme
MAGYLIVNPHSGHGNATKELVREAEARGIGVHVLRDGDDVPELARRADADALGVAGGDGSLAAVVEVALERGLPFVCIPFGTRNHFARDVGLDRDDPIGALDAFVHREERRIDVGRANGRLFLNNVSLGVYARLVRRREHHRRRSDAFARLRAFAILVQKRDPIGITIDGHPIKARVVLVSNNAYQLDFFSLGERERIDAGRLHLYIPTGLLRRAWIEREAETFEIGAMAGRLDAAVDGEPEVLEPPIEFTIEPRALRVLLPRSPRAQDELLARERHLLREGITGEPAQLLDVVGRDRLAVAVHDPRDGEDVASVVRLDVDAHQRDRVHVEPRLLQELPA